MSENRKMLGFDQAESARIVRERRQEALNRLAEAEAKVAAVKASAAIPEACGPDIAPAPARGAFATFRPIEIVPGSAGTARQAGYRGPGEVRHRVAIRRADVFDAMIEDARRRHATAGEDAGPFVPPFTPGQVQVARDYRDRCERRSAGGVRCAPLEAGRGGGAGGEFIDAFVADGIRLADMIERIGEGAALPVRRLRPSLRGDATRDITARALVDMVCLDGMSLKRVLVRHGWTVNAGRIAILRKALAAALDRMQGYR